MKSTITQEEMMAIIDEYVVEDKPIEDIVKGFGHAKSDFYKYLRVYKLTEYYREQRIKRDAHTRDIMRDEAIHSLRKKINGYDYEVREVEGEHGKDKEGNDVFVPKKVKRKTMQQAPSDTAIIYALNNLDPTNWKSRTHEEVSTELKSKIDWHSIPIEDRQKFMAMLSQGKKE